MSKKETMQPFDPSKGRKNREVKATTVAKMVKQRIGPIELGTDNPQDIMNLGWVDPDKIIFNYSRQRFAEPSHQKNLDKKWKTYLMTPGQARLDSNGFYYVADGQQHITHFINKYPGQQVPMCWVESDDPNVESEMLLALNVDSLPMAKYFVHEQKIAMGYAVPIAIEQAVIDADCETGFKLRRPGSITHMIDLYNAFDRWGGESLTIILTKMRTYWPKDKIYTATMNGFLKVKELLEVHGKFDDDLFDDVFIESGNYFEDSNRLHLDIKREFEYAHPTNYKGMNNTEKVASGIINVYEKATGNDLVPMPFKIDMPMMETHETIS